MFKNTYFIAFLALMLLLAAAIGLAYWRKSRQRRIEQEAKFATVLETPQPIATEPIRRPEPELPQPPVLVSNEQSKTDKQPRKNDKKGGVDKRDNPPKLSTEQVQQYNQLQQDLKEAPSPEAKILLCEGYLQNTTIPRSYKAGVSGQLKKLQAKLTPTE